MILKIWSGVGGCDGPNDIFCLSIKFATIEGAFDGGGECVKVSGKCSWKGLYRMRIYDPWLTARIVRMNASDEAILFVLRC
jgi:hypothetical protein